MILSLFILALATIVIVVSIFEFLAQHLSPFLELALPCRTTFAFVISPFIAGGFPAFESLSHIAVKIRLALLYQKNYSIASNLSPIDIPKKVFEKYKMALINPRRSPLAPLQKGGTGLLVPPCEGGFRGIDNLTIVTNKTFQTPSNGLAIIVPRGYANEIAVKLPNQYILDLPEDLDIQRLEKR